MEVETAEARTRLLSYIDALLGERTVLALPAAWREEPKAARLVTYGEAGEVCPLLSASLWREGKWETALHLRLGEAELTAATPCVGAPHAVNATAATALLHGVGVPVDAVRAGLAEAQPCGRLEPLYTPNGTIYFDVAYTGSALERALSLLREVTEGRLFVLLGSVGGRARERRAPLGAAAGLLADHVYFTADDPDGEDPGDILQDLLADFPKNGFYTYEPDREAAIRRAVSALQAGDVLLILGKALAETQLIRGELQPFSDRDAAAKALSLHTPSAP